MATTKAILSQIKLDGIIKDLISKSDGENVTVTYNGKSETLTEALAEILTSVQSLPTSDGMTTAINEAVAGIVDGAPESFNTLKEIAAYIESHKEVSDALDAAIGNKVDKVDGKGLSAEDFTTALKNKLDSMPEITAADVQNWNSKASTVIATQSANGLMSAEDKAKLDKFRGVRVGTTAPNDMQDGEVFVQLINE